MVLELVRFSAKYHNMNVIQ